MVYFYQEMGTLKNENRKNENKGGVSMERKQVIAGAEEAVTGGRLGKKQYAGCCQQGKASLLPHCMICGEIPERGIMDGIFIQGQFLCTACEQSIVTLDGDRVSREEYLAIAKKLKNLIS